MVDSNNPQGTKIAKETLTGDLCRFLQDRLKNFPKTWQEMTEDEQVEQNQMIETAVREAVSEAVNIIASEGRKVVKAELGKITVDKGLKAEIKANTMDADELISVQGKTILLVTNSDNEFIGGEKLKADPDQPDMLNTLGNEYDPNADGQDLPEPKQADDEEDTANNDNGYDDFEDDANESDEDDNIAPVARAA